MLHGSQLRRSTAPAQAHGGLCFLQLPGNDGRPSAQEQRHGAHLQQLALLQSSSSLPAQQTVQ